MFDGWLWSAMRCRPDITIPPSLRRDDAVAIAVARRWSSHCASDLNPCLRKDDVVFNEEEHAPDEAFTACLSLFRWLPHRHVVS